MGSNEESFARWFLSYFLTTEHFKNMVTMVLVLTYCALMITGRDLNNEFSLLVGMVLGAYFKKSAG